MKRRRGIVFKWAVIKVSQIGKIHTYHGYDFFKCNNTFETAITELTTGCKLPSPVRTWKEADQFMADKTEQELTEAINKVKKRLDYCKIEFPLNKEGKNE